MEIADMNDLKLEQWIRQRNSAQIIWKTNVVIYSYYYRLCNFINILLINERW